LIRVLSNSMAVSARVRSLQTRLAEATTGELEAKALLRKARRQAQRSNKNRCWRLDTASTIMIMQNGQFDAALRYCDQEGLDLFESRKRLEQELLDGNMEDMVARLHPRTPYEKNWWLVPKSSVRSTNWRHGSRLETKGKVWPQLTSMSSPT